MPTLWIAGAVVAVIVVRRISPIAGAVLGMCVAVALGIWGHMTYSGGAGVAFAGVRLTEPVFLGLVAVWLGIETYALVLAFKRRAQPTGEGDEGNGEV